LLSTSDSLKSDVGAFKPSNAISCEEDDNLSPIANFKELLPKFKELKDKALIPVKSEAEIVLKS
jgi:hypothetical protein